MERRNRRGLNRVNREQRRGAPERLEVTQSQNVLARQSQLGGVVDSLFAFSNRARTKQANELAEAKLEDAQGVAQRQAELLGVEDDRIKARTEIAETANQLEVQNALVDARLDLERIFRESEDDPEFDITPVFQEYFQEKRKDLAGNLSLDKFDIGMTQLRGALEGAQADLMDQRSMDYGANQLSQLFLGKVRTGDLDVKGIKGAIEQGRLDGNKLGLTRKETEELLVQALLPEIAKGNFDAFDALDSVRPRNAGKFTNDPLYRDAILQAKDAGIRYLKAQEADDAAFSAEVKARTELELEDAAESEEFDPAAVVSAQEAGLISDDKAKSLFKQNAKFWEDEVTRRFIDASVLNGTAISILDDEIKFSALQDSMDRQVQQAQLGQDPTKLQALFNSGKRLGIMSSSLKKGLDAASDPNNPETFIRAAEQVTAWSKAGNGTYFATHLSDGASARYAAFRSLTEFAGMTPEQATSRLAEANVTFQEAQRDVQQSYRAINNAVSDLADTGFISDSVNVGDIERTLAPMVQSQLMLGLGIDAAIDAAKDQWESTYVEIGNLSVRRDANTPEDFPDAANEFLADDLPGILEANGLETDDDYTVMPSSIPGQYYIIPEHGAAAPLINPKTSKPIMLDARRLSEEKRLQGARSGQKRNRTLKEKSEDIQPQGLF